MEAAPLYLTLAQVGIVSNNEDGDLGGPPRRRGAGVDPVALPGRLPTEHQPCLLARSSSLSPALPQPSQISESIFSSILNIYLFALAAISGCVAWGAALASSYFFH